VHINENENEIENFEMSSRFNRIKRDEGGWVLCCGVVNICFAYVCTRSVHYFVIIFSYSMRKKGRQTRRVVGKRESVRDRERESIPR
jgi:hypothetical protein